MSGHGNATLLTRIGSILGARKGSRRNTDHGVRDSIAELVAEAAKTPDDDGDLQDLDRQERALIANVLRLRGTVADDVMIPRADIVAMPTLSRPALPIDQDFFGPIEIDNQSVENLRAAWYPYTMPFNLTGHPAISLPCGFDAAGMPLAIQLVARPGEDERLLRVAALFEAARPWSGRTPTI